MGYLIVSIIQIVRFLFVNNFHIRITSERLLLFLLLDRPFPSLC
jgi:hypothetical protein